MFSHAQSTQSSTQRERSSSRNSELGQEEHYSDLGQSFGSSGGRLERRWIFGTSRLSVPRAGSACSSVQSQHWARGDTTQRLKSMLRQGRRGNISKVGTCWLNASLGACIKHGKNSSQGELFLALFRVLPPSNYFPCVGSIKLTCCFCPSVPFFLLALAKRPSGSTRERAGEEVLRSGFLRAEEAGGEEGRCKAAQRAGDSFLALL